MKPTIKNYSLAVDFLFTNLVALDVAIINKEEMKSEVDFITAEKLKMLPKFLEILDEYSKNVKENFNEERYEVEPLIKEILQKQKIK